MDLALRMAGGLRDHLCGFQLMRWLARVFASAIARRIAYVLVALILAWAGIGTSKAATYRCTDLGAMCDEGEAYSEAWAHARDAAQNPAYNVPCVYKSGTQTFVAAGYSGSCSGSRVSTKEFYFTKSCESRPDWNGPYPYLNGGKPKNGSVTCNAGCKQAWYSNGDGYFNGKYSSVPGTCNNYDDNECKAQFGDGYHWNAGMSACEPDDGKCKDGGKQNSLGQCAPEPCPDGMAQQADGTCKKKENECPAGQVRSPDGKCLPGDGQCASGEVRGPDGTCKKDGDGDGQPDEPGEKDTFSGGDDCNSPPSCSGSPIMCGQARIQWRIDCNTRKNRNIAGGLCNSMPVCTGEKCDAMEYAGLLMQWRSACALEKMASDSGNSGGNADVKAIRDALTGTGGSVTTPADRPASDVWSPNSGQPTRPDASGYGWGRGCPQPPAIEVMGRTIAFDTTPLCRWLGLGSYFVVGLAALFCLRIIASKDA